MNEESLRFRDSQAASGWREQSIDSLSAAIDVDLISKSDGVSKLLERVDA